jgi:4-hydroxy-4-methyl-2-oxoglutarate aldolase
MNANKKHPHQGVVVRRIERASQRAVQALAKTYSGFILDRMGKYGVMHQAIKPLDPGMRVCGTAVTALGPDLSVRRMAIDLAQEGDVVVVAAGGTVDYACFGDGTALKMRLKGVAGAVIDGATRDSGRVVALGFPTFVRGATPRNYHYPVDTDHGAVNVPVVCGGVLVHPGDVVFGDADGVVIVPRQVAESLSATIAREFDEEAEMRRAMTQYSPFGLEEELRSRGYRFE